jgi:hypothetical protein
MEGRNKEMEFDVTMQQDDESIWIESDQPMEDRSKHDLEQITKKP